MTGRTTSRVAAVALTIGLAGLPGAASIASAAPGTAPLTVTSVSGSDTNHYTMVTPRSGDVNLRRGPGVKYRVVDTLEAGTRAVYVNKASKNWYRLEGIDATPWSTAFVHAPAVKIVNVTCRFGTCWEAPA